MPKMTTTRKPMARMRLRAKMRSTIFHTAKRRTWRARTMRTMSWAPKRTTTKTMNHKINFFF